VVVNGSSVAITVLVSQGQGDEAHTPPRNFSHRSSSEWQNGDLMIFAFLERRLDGSQRFRKRKGNRYMKLPTMCKNLLPGLALLLATSAFAANNVNKGSFEVFDPLTVSGHQLAPGQYKLTWDGTSSSVELMILSQGKLVATVLAHLIELSQAERNNATVSHKNDDGSQSLTQIDFAGKKYALSFGNESAATESTLPGGSH
jgi:hypothetical protein